MRVILWYVTRESILVVEVIPTFAVYFQPCVLFGINLPVLCLFHLE